MRGSPSIRFAERVADLKQSERRQIPPPARLLHEPEGRVNKQPRSGWLRGHRPLGFLPRAPQESVGFGEADESCALETDVSSAFGDDIG